jgi:hypothetical protein
MREEPTPPSQPAGHRQSGGKDSRVVAAAPFDFIFVDGDHTFDGLVTW